MSFFRKGVNAARTCVRGPVRRAVRFGGDGGSPPSSLVTQANVMMDCEASTAGTTLTVPILDAMTKETRPLIDYSITAPTPSQLKVGSTVTPPLSTIQVNGVNFSTPGTRSIELLQDIQSTFILADLNTPRSQDISVGFSFYLEDAGDADLDLTWISIDDGGGDFVTFQTRDDGTFLHTDLGDISGPTIAFETWYWITILAVQSGTCKMDIYTAAGVQLGSTVTLGTDASANWNQIRIGRTDAHGGTASNAKVFYDNITFDFENAKFPLGVTGADASQDPSGFLIVEGFEGTGLPLGFETNNATFDFDDASSPSPLVGAQSLRMTSPGDIGYNLFKDYPTFYMYAVMNPVSKGSADIIQLSNPKGTDHLASFWSGGNFKWSGFAGTAAWTTGATMHLWLEYDAGNSRKLFLSSNATKPASPDIDDSSFSGSTAITYFHLLSGGVMVYDSLIIDDSPIGSDPLA